MHDKMSIVTIIKKKIFKSLDRNQYKFSKCPKICCFQNYLQFLLKDIIVYPKRNIFFHVESFAK